MPLHFRALPSRSLKHFALLGALVSAPLTAAAQPSGSGPAPNGQSASPALPAAKPQNEQRFAVGKWPEGLVMSQGSLWVAQSGVRSLGQYGPATGKLLATVPIGRLPVSMAVGPDGAIFAEVGTDAVIKRVDPKSNKVTNLKALPDGPEGMVVEGGFAYVLMWRNGSSAVSAVARIDLKTGRMTQSADTGANAFDLAVGGGRVWVTNTDGRVVSLDAETLAPKDVAQLGGRPFYMAFGAGAAFSAGGPSVVRLAAETGQRTHQVDLEGDVSTLGAWDDHVVAVTREGVIWLLDPATLAVQARLAPAAPYTPQAITRDGQTLLITSHLALDGSENGSVVRVALP